MPSPECDGAGGDQDHFLTALAHPSDVRHEAFEPRAVETTLLGLDQQRRADLHDHALGVGQAVGARLAVFNVHGGNIAIYLAERPPLICAVATGTAVSRRTIFRG